MAVTFDSSFEKGFHQPGASPVSFVSNAGTVAGSVGSNSNRVLIGYAATTDSSVTSAAMTWNSVSMTLITSLGGSGTPAGTGMGGLFLFGLIAPATGAQTLSFSWSSGAGDVHLGALSFYNVDQATGWQNAGSDTGTSTSASSVITSANGNMAVVGHLDNNASSLTISSPSAGWTELTLDDNSAQAYNASTSSSTTITLTLGSSVAWANVKADIIVVAASDTLFGQAVL